MSDQLEDLVLALLQRIEASLIELRADVADLTSRIIAVEIQVGQLVAAEQSHHGVIIARLDRIESRIDRLERHVGALPA